MDRAEREIRDIMLGLSDEETLALLESLEPEAEKASLTELQRQRIKHNVLAGIDKSSVAAKRHTIPCRPSSSESLTDMSRPTFKAKKPVIAAAVILLVLAGAITPAGRQILAEIREKLYFIPGLGEVIENKGTEVYILSEPIELGTEGGRVLIASIVKQGRSLQIEMSGDGYEAPAVTIEDKKGTAYESSHSWSGVGYGWTATYLYEIPDDLLEFSIVIPGGRVAQARLTRARGFDDYAELGPTDYKNGLGLTVLASRADGKVRLNIVEHAKSGRKVKLYGYYDRDAKGHRDIRITDDKGNIYPLDEYQWPLANVSAYSFTPDPDISEYTVAIPQVQLSYKIDKKVTVPIPAEGETIEIGKALDINGFELRLLKAEREGDTLRLYVDTGYSSKHAENISVLHLALPYRSYSYSYNYNEYITADRYDLEIRPEDKKVTITFTELVTTLKGPWKFEISVK
ncbi:MAG TPA: hypothetical protein PK830_10315 [Candidatus Atribacteria bacterium]|nr:hypothetical protein [Candidatus Atribacteria bacterium]HPT79469.1 hypothetical protein [Candidatus Atribacteria bacterium]